MGTNVIPNALHIQIFKLRPFVGSKKTDKENNRVISQLATRPSMHLVKFDMAVSLSHLCSTYTVPQPGMPMHCTMHTQAWKKKMKKNTKKLNELSLLQRT